MKIKQVHFEKAMRYACRGVSDTNIMKYNAFGQTFYKYLCMNDFL